MLQKPSRQPVSKRATIITSIVLFLLLYGCGWFAFTKVFGGSGSSSAATPTPALTQVQGVADPTQVSTLSPTQAPTLTVQFTCAQGTDNVSAKVCVHTLPGAQLTITVTYCSGKKATSNSLKGVKTANSQGNYTWTWVPQTSCRGNVSVEVTASLGDQSDTEGTDFTLK